METWLTNGAQLGWLIDPINKTTHVFRPNLKTEIIEGFDKKLNGDAPVDGFVLDLSRVKTLLP